ncbi:glycosyltransferase family 1 protein [Patescibacteria group bacterium]|nr:MAG: glycosyltransferase family 1 protein [Patescibacteria group bacterium]
MRIGIDCRTIQEKEPAGTAHYTKELAKALLDVDSENDYFLFFNQEKNIPADLQKSNAKIIILPKKTLPFISSHWQFSRDLKKYRLDIFHGPANTLPIGFNGTSILTIHDLAIYINPEWFPKQNFSTKFIVPRSLAKAKKIIAVSESTKQDLQKIFRVPTEKIKVIHEGVRTEEPNEETKNKALEKFDLQEKKYFLFLGTIEPRKNLIALIAAYKILVQKNPTAPLLVLAGGGGWKNDDIFEAVKKRGLENKIKYIGYVSNKEKFALMKKALVFVYPSLYEGFGLPILEAMSSATPVITSRISSIPEIAGDGALMIDPNNDDEIANALEKLWKDGGLRADLIAKGEARIKQFSWTKTAEKTLQTYREIE